MSLPEGVAEVAPINVGHDVRAIVRAGLLGAVLTAKDASTVEPWARIKVVGVADYGQEGGNVISEVLVVPADSFAPPIPVDVEALNAAYEIAQDGTTEAAWESPSDPAELAQRPRDNAVDLAAVTLQAQAMAARAQTNTEDKEQNQ